MPALVGLAAAVAVAQEDLFVTVSAPAKPAAAATVQPAAEEDLFVTVSSAAKPAEPAQAPVAPAVAEPKISSAEKPADGEWEREMLRDPFWPVGFFPPDWNVRRGPGEPDPARNAWKAAAGLIRISGTSQLGGRTVAIINGQLKNEGDLLEIKHEGVVYRWRIVGIQADGQVQLKKQENQ